MRNFIVLIMLFCANMVFAQRDVTKFMGIPVDGTKAEMIQKLKAKGFTPRRVGTSDFMEGEFNGTDVNLHIVTNNNKVYRIMLFDKNNQDEADIKIRFNYLVNQFENNEKYVSLGQYKIPDSEDISYEMLVHNKRYKAGFYQNLDSNRLVWFRICEIYGKYYIAMYYDNEYNKANGEDL